MALTKAENCSKSRLYDFVIIGSGPAGVAAAVQASKIGKRVVIVEKHPEKLGGTWLHFGTIPSKTIREVLATVQSLRPHFGEKWVSRLVNGLSIEQLMERAQSVSADEEVLVLKHLKANNIEIIRGFGSVASGTSVKVHPEQGDPFLIDARKIMVATGSSPRRPADVPFDGWRILDSDHLLSIETLPSSIMIYGAGVIGCEYACIFGALGIKTTIVDVRSKIMQNIDQDLAVHLQKMMEVLGINFILGKSLKKISTASSHAVLELADRKVEAEVCFFAAGRVSQTNGMGLEDLGIETNAAGAITVNDYFQTKISTVYAAGDAIGPPALASTSLEQGRIAANHAFGNSNRTFPRVFPLGIYTIPELSSVGLSEEKVKESGEAYVVGSAMYDEVARGCIRGESHGLLKIIVAKENQKILGVHIAGSDAANLIHIGLCCMLADLPITALVDSMVFNYPTLAEAYRVAAFNAINKLDN